MSIYEERVMSFCTAWVVLSDAGVCDELAGGEWRRIWSEWKAAGFPADVKGFIRARANIPPNK